jgi:tRNA A37 threonylcarbamoyladenosine modification protein TsaB
MTREWQDGRWLLIDAAGPALVMGILEKGSWLCMETFSGGFLESLKPGVKTLLEKSSLELNSLSGIICSSGPGSTLGLRLAAMFVRTLLQQPGLEHWQCLTYNNLELACADRSKPGGPMCRLAAPWRRDRLHLATFHPGPPAQFKLEAVPAEETTGLPVVELGNRVASLPEEADRISYPAEKIPQILGDWPDLLSQTRQPELYSVETPEFARWTSTRHPQK